MITTLRQLMQYLNVRPTGYAMLLTENAHGDYTIRFNETPPIVQNATLLAMIDQALRGGGDDALVPRPCTAVHAQAGNAYTCRRPAGHRGQHYSDPLHGDEHIALMAWYDEGY